VRVPPADNYRVGKTERRQCPSPDQSLVCRPGSQGDRYGRGIGNTGRLITIKNDQLKAQIKKLKGLLDDQELESGRAEDDMDELKA
jgi:hypothetical protein